MTKINYDSVLKELRWKYPHNIDAIEKVLTDFEESEKNNGHYFYAAQHGFSLEDIINDRNWVAFEKARLIRFLGYNKKNYELQIKIDGIEKTRTAIECCMIKDDYVTFQALAQTFFDIEYRSKAEEERAYRDLVSSIKYYVKDLEKQAKYLEYLLSITQEKDLKMCLASTYEGFDSSRIDNKSIFFDILNTCDIELIKKYIDYIDDIKIFLPFAVSTGSIRVVNLLISAGADVNYVSPEPVLYMLTPLKVAIGNNDYAMFNFLVENGADITLSVEKENMKFLANNPKIDIHYTCDWWNVEKNKRVDDSSVNYLNYLYESTPLEYAIKNPKISGYSNDSNYDVCFDGVNNRMKASDYEVRKDVASRKKIVERIYDSLPKDTYINYKDLITFTIVIRDYELFETFAKDMIKKGVKFNLTDALNLFVKLKRYKNLSFVKVFLDYCEKIFPEENVTLELFKVYLKSIKDNFIYFGEFAEYMLERMSEEERKTFALMPRCDNRRSFDVLNSFGFDINQTDENGDTMLHNLSSKYSFDSEDCKFFEFVLSKADLSKKNKQGKTALHYIIKYFKTEDEYYNADVNKKHEISFKEKAAIKLINAMDKEDVCDPSIEKILYERYTTYKDRTYHMNAEVIYRNHQELFEALLAKGFTLSKELFEHIVSEITSNETYVLKDRINVEETLEFIFEKLDKEPGVQKISIDAEYDKFVKEIRKCGRSEESYALIESEFKKLYDSLQNAKKYYSESIMNKHLPEQYLSYVKNTYDISYYDNMDQFIVMAIIRILHKFGIDRITHLLELCPEFDINTKIFDKDLGLSYWDCLCDSYDVENDLYLPGRFEPMGISYVNSYEQPDSISFSGGLMQYAILTDSKQLAEFLFMQGASCEFVVEENEKKVDHSLDYVSSFEMQKYIERVTGKIKFGELVGDEAAYLLQLINSTENKENQ